MFRYAIGQVIEVGEGEGRSFDYAGTSAAPFIPLLVARKLERLRDVNHHGAHHDGDGDFPDPIERGNEAIAGPRPGGVAFGDQASVGLTVFVYLWIMERCHSDDEFAFQYFCCGSKGAGMKCYPFLRKRLMQPSQFLLHRKLVQIDSSIDRFRPKSDVQNNTAPHFPAQPLATLQGVRHCLHAKLVRNQAHFEYWNPSYESVFENRVLIRFTDFRAEINSL